MAERRAAPPSPEGLEITMLGGNCPVQAEGVFGPGRELYFRARGERWSFGIEGRGPAGEAWSASGARGNSGWLAVQEAQERVLAHAWAWSGAERGLEAAGPAGALAAAIRASDPAGVEAALAAGADPGAPLEAGAPTPLCMALIMGCRGAAGEDPEAAEAAPEAEAEVIERFHREACIVSEGARAKGRLGVVKALLAAGAHPEDVAPGWAMAPIHWAALLPAGQRASLADAFLDELEPGEGESAATRARRAQERAEPAAAAMNPLGALLLAGADPARARVWEGGDASDALDLCVDSGSWRWARALAERLGQEGMARYAGALLGAAQRDKSMASFKTSPPRGAHLDWTAMSAAKELLEGLESGDWPIEWLDRALEARPRCAEAAADLRGKALSAIEAAKIGAAAPSPGQEGSALLGRFRSRI